MSISINSGHKYGVNITEIHSQLGGNIEKSFVERVIQDMYISRSDTRLT